MSVVEATKTCTKCHEPKPIEEFPVRLRSRVPRVQGVCRACTRKRKRANRASAKRRKDPVELVPNAPFRARLEQMEMLWDLERRTWRGSDEYVADSWSPASLIAIRMGWMPKKDGKPRPDSTRVKRVVGLKASAPSWKAGKRYEGNVREMIPYELAVQLCRAMDADPVDMGV